MWDKQILELLKQYILLPFGVCNFLNTQQIVLLSVLSLQPKDMRHSVLVYLRLTLFSKFNTLRTCTHHNLEGWLSAAWMKFSKELVANDWSDESETRSAVIVEEFI